MLPIRDQNKGDGMQHYNEEDKYQFTLNFKHNVFLKIENKN